MAQSRRPVDHLAVIGAESFDSNWTVIGSGGFSQVYKVRHHQWRRDVAVKILCRDDGSSSEEDLTREADLMLSAECPYIMRALGVFRGHTPFSALTYVGIVMDLMEGGSLYSLQKKRKCQLLPWPLVFRLAHHVALGMNYLHGLTPNAVIHKDLKPQNILLDSCLNVKITDFGIGKFAKSVTAIPVKGMGTAFYAPPEASLGGATCAYDVYSYAILLWTILNPAYNEAWFDVSNGARPSLKDVRIMKAPGLEELVELMERCWTQDPDQRPTFAECTDVTEGLYEKYIKCGIRDAVYKVQLELDGVPQPDVPQPGVPQYELEKKLDELEIEKRAMEEQQKILDEKIAVQKRSQEAMEEQQKILDEKIAVQKRSQEEMLDSRQSRTQAMRVLLRGVQEFDIRGEACPGELLLHGPRTFPIGTTQSGRVFLAGAYHGQGRVVVFTHESYLGRQELAPFLHNALHWLDKGRRGLVGVQRKVDFARPVLSQSGLQCRTTGFQKDLSVFVCDSYSDEHKDEILNFVAEGGGLLIGGHAWYWCYTRSLTDYPGNRLLSRMGVSLTEHALDAGCYPIPRI